MERKCNEHSECKSDVNGCISRLDRIDNPQDGALKCTLDTVGLIAQAKVSFKIFTWTMGGVFLLVAASFGYTTIVTTSRGEDIKAATETLRLELQTSNLAQDKRIEDFMVTINNRMAKAENMQADTLKAINEHRIYSGERLKRTLQ